MDAKDARETNFKIAKIGPKLVRNRGTKAKTVSLYGYIGKFLACENSDTEVDRYEKEVEESDGDCATISTGNGAWIGGCGVWRFGYGGPRRRAGCSTSTCCPTGIPACRGCTCTCHASTCVCAYFGTCRAARTSAGDARAACWSADDTGATGCYGSTGTGCCCTCPCGTGSTSDANAVGRKTGFKWSGCPVAVGSWAAWRTAGRDYIRGL